MSVDHHKQNQLLDLLITNELIKAVIIIDELGHAKGRRGRARCIRLDDADGKETMLLTTPTKASRESVYIAAAGNNDYLLVVFDEQVSFDSLKIQVEEAITTAGLALPSE